MQDLQIMLVNGLYLTITFTFIYIREITYTLHMHQLTIFFVLIEILFVSPHIFVGKPWNFIFMKT